MNKKEVFLRILRTLEAKPRIAFICTDAEHLRHMGLFTQGQTDAFQVWIQGMIEDHYTVIGWLKEADLDFYMKVNIGDYRKAWIAHLITYLESLP